MAFGGFLQANTAVDLMVGPFVDDTDGKTAETGLTITQAEVRLSKNAGNMAQKNEATSLTHDELGNYVCKLNTTDTNTEGILTIMVHESGALPIKMDYMVLAQAAYISHVTAKDAGFMDVNIKTVGRTDTQETEADNLESACSNYSVTRGLTGTAVPAAVADAAGGLPISDAGGLDLDTQLATADQIGAAGVGLTEAGGDGDHLTAINLPNQTMNITGNLSGSVGSLTGHTNQTGDNFARLGAPAGASVSADIAAIKTVDDAIKVITDALTAAGAAKLALGATTMITGIVSWDNTNATTTVIYSSDITEATADHFNGRLFVPTSGALLGQYTEITDYALDTGEGKFTVTALTEPPADNTTFVIL